MYYVAVGIIALVFIWRIRVGLKKGMVGEIISLISMVIAGVCLALILTAVDSYVEEQITKVIQAVISLFVLCLIYKIVSVLFTSLKLISNLPIIKGLNALLGAVLGAAEAVVIVAIAVRLLKYFSISLLS